MSYGRLIARAINVLVQAAGVGTGIRAVRAVRLQGAALEDIEAILHSLARVVHSSTIHAHVRAATPGMPVTETNCQPFARGRFAFMHNGHVGDFRTVRRPMRRQGTGRTRPKGKVTDVHDLRGRWFGG